MVSSAGGFFSSEHSTKRLRVDQVRAYEPTTSVPSRGRHHDRSSIWMRVGDPFPCLLCTLSSVVLASVAVLFAIDAYPNRPDHSTPSLLSYDFYFTALGGLKSGIYTRSRPHGNRMGGSCHGYVGAPSFSNFFHLSSYRERPAGQRSSLAPS